MKKINFFLTAILTTTFIASCSEELDKNSLNSEETTISVKMTKGTANGVSRAETIAVDVDDPVSFQNGYLYFVAEAQITKRVQILTSGPTDNENTVLYSDLINAGVTLKNIKGSSTDAYFIGNLPAGVNPPASGDISDVLQAISSINSQNDENGGVANVSLYGTDLIYEPTGWTYGDPKILSMEVDAITSRLEIPFFKLDGAITGFQVDGIFLNYFYHEAQIDGTTKVANFVTYSSNSNWYPDGETYFGTGTPDYTGITFDYNEITGLGAFESTNSKYYPDPANLNKLWAYNLLAGGEAPHIIIKLSQITTSNGRTFPDPQYITVKGMKKDGTILSKIEGGNIYAFIEGIPIHEDNLNPLPEIDLVDVEVEVTIMPWEDVSVIHEF